jgi:hypothetical protein
MARSRTRGPGDRAGAERHYELAILRDQLDPNLYSQLIALAERRGDWRKSAALAAGGSSSHRASIRRGRRWSEDSSSRAPGRKG